MTISAKKSLLLMGLVLATVATLVESFAVVTTGHRVSAFRSSNSALFMADDEDASTERTYIMVSLAFLSYLT
jgi:hypothetical protein